jgi:hypothetical protein
MDRTAVASIVIGLGATVAAMVFPTKYPKTPKWAIEVTWYGGLFLVIASVAYLISEHPFRDLGGAAIAAFEWFSAYLIAVQRLPGFWLVIVFAAGMAANHWGTPLILTWWRRGNVDRNPLVTTWLTPLQAAERFVDPEFFQGIGQRKKMPKTSQKK